jgi:hypothetical protein
MEMHMKIISIIFLILPTIAFACPQLTGTYKCSNTNANERIDSMTFSSTEVGFKIFMQRFGWHIVEGNDQPLSGKPVIEAYTSTESYKMGRHTTENVDGEGGRFTSDVFCEDNSIIGKFEAVGGALGELPLNSELKISVTNNGQLTYEQSTWGTVTCKKKK